MFLSCKFRYMVALKHEHTLRDIKIQIIVHDHFSISAGLHAGGLTTLPLAGLRWMKQKSSKPITPHNLRFGRFYPFWYLDILDCLKLPNPFFESDWEENTKNRPQNFKLVIDFHGCGLRVLCWLKATKLPMYPKWSQEFQVFGELLREWIPGMETVSLYEQLSCEEKRWRFKGHHKVEGTVGHLVDGLFFLHPAGSGERFAMPLALGCLCQRQLASDHSGHSGAEQIHKLIFFWGMLHRYTRYTPATSYFSHVGLASHPISPWCISCARIWSWSRI